MMSIHLVGRDGAFCDGPLASGAGACTRSLISVVGLAVLSVLALPPQANSVEVENLTTRVVLFNSRGFEQDTPGRVPTQAGPGVWLPAGSGLSDVLSSVPPGAATGSDYLAVSRASAPGAVTTADFLDQTALGDRIYVVFMMNVPPRTPQNWAWASPCLRDSKGGYPIALGLWDDGSSTRIRSFDGVGWTPTGLSYVAGQWHKYEIEYMIGQAQYTLKVDGSSVVMPTALSTGIARFTLEHLNYPQTYYIDSAPPHRPFNDNCDDAIAIGDGRYLGSTFGATNDGTSSCGNAATSPDVWYRYTSPRSGSLRVNTCGSAFDTVVSVHSAASCPGTAATELANGCQDNCSGVPCGGPTSCASIAITQDESYLIRVAGASGASGHFILDTLDPMLRITWHIGPNLPQGFQDSNGGIIDNMLVSVAGFCSGENVPSKPDKYPFGFLKKVWGLDLLNRQAGWTALPDFPGDARQALMAARVGSQLYLWGGFSVPPPYCCVAGCFKDGWKLSQQNGSWVWDRLPDLPWAISSSALAVIGTRIYAFGGADYDYYTFFTETDRNGQNLGLGARLLVFDTANVGLGWQQLPDCPGTPRFVHVLCAVQGKLYAIGGATGNNNSYRCYCTVVDNWLFDPEHNEWSPLPDLPVSSGNFQGTAAVFGDRYIVLVAGYQYPCAFDTRVAISPYGTVTKSAQPNQEYNADVFVYDTRAGSFGRASPLPLNNNLPMTVVHGEEIFLIGGETGGGWLKDAPEGTFYDPAGEYFGHHPDLCLIGTIEPATVSPDLDRDGDVDQEDFGFFQACLTGQGMPQLQPECQKARLDNDGDVDQDDLSIFLRCRTGPGGPVIPGCDAP